MKSEVGVETTDNEMMEGINMTGRRGMSGFWGKFKNSLIDIFKEEEDHKL